MWEASSAAAPPDGLHWLNHGSHDREVKAFFVPRTLSWRG